MNIYELLIDENEDYSGVQAISIVENPAIQSDFVALADEKPVILARTNEDKRILMGAALIPDKPIYRNQDGEEFYIYFSKETVAKAAEMFFKKSNHQNATLEHQQPIEGMTVFESWIVEDPNFDKSKKYGLDVPEGTWMVSMKVDDESIWTDQVKNDKVFGFSIEGSFANALRKEVAHPLPSMLSDQKLDAVLSEMTEIVAEFYEDEKKKLNLKTYSDYPQAARNNAKRAIAYKEKNGSSCGTSVGWTRARQLASGEALSRSTIARMASFKRHQQNKDVPYSEGCGGIMWDAWGGSAGVNWAISKLKKIDSKK